MSSELFYVAERTPDTSRHPWTSIQSACNADEIDLNGMFAARHRFPGRSNNTGRNGLHPVLPIYSCHSPANLNRYPPHFHAAFGIKFHSQASNPGGPGKPASKTEETRGCH